MAAQNFKEAATQLLNWRASKGEATNFSSKLFELIAKADPQNIHCLSLGFIHEVKAYVEWMKSSGDDGIDFFIKHGLMFEEGRNAAE